jgi:hypothetical protein
VKVLEWDLELVLGSGLMSSAFEKGQELVSNLKVVKKGILWVQILQVIWMETVIVRWEI